MAPHGHAGPDNLNLDVPHGFCHAVTQYRHGDPGTTSGSVGSQIRPGARAASDVLVIQVVTAESRPGRGPAASPNTDSESPSTVTVNVKDFGRRVGQNVGT